MGLGKWIVGALGWAMFGPIGGILGYYFASRVEKLAEATVVYVSKGFATFCTFIRFLSSMNLLMLNKP